ncbi:MAG: hypothetical protein JRI34_06905, partial [Deltaproteobacteria bacterium]|nr:hypothetical protein [Deltaproteobacteria bacterium]
MIDFQPNKKLVEFFLAFRPEAANCLDELSWEEIQSDGSDRSFFRVRFRSETALVVEGQDRAENRYYELIGR